MECLKRNLSMVCFLYHGSYTEFSGIEAGPLVDLTTTDFQSNTIACIYDRTGSGLLLCG